jgi:hypothetical protein
MDEGAAPQAAVAGGHTGAEVFSRELGLLRFHWDSAYEIEPGDGPGMARARRRDGEGGWLEGTPDELTVMLAADYLARPVSREVAP